MLRLVLRRGVTLALVGVTLGVAISFAATRAMAGLLYGVSAADPITFAVVPVVLLAVSSLAGYVPALRATRVDPLVALREE